MRVFIIVGLFILFNSVFAANIKLVSEPSESDVYVKVPGTPERIKVGKTPFDMNIDQFISNFAKGTTFLLSFERDGYETYNVLVGYANKSDLELNVNLMPSKDFVISKNFDAIAGTLFESQRLIRMQRYDDAVELMNGLEKKYPYLSTVYEIKAIALYLKKDFNGALAYFRKAFSKNPENLDAYNMKEYLEKSLGAEKGRP